VAVEDVTDAVASFLQSRPANELPARHVGPSSSISDT